MQEEDPYYYDSDEISIKEDFTKWKESPRNITVRLDLGINRTSDEGLHEFVRTYLALSESHEDITLSVEVAIASEPPGHEVRVRVGGEEFKDLRAQEVLRKLQSSRIVLFHNSTELRPPYYRSKASGSLRDFSEDFTKEVDELQNKVDHGLRKIAKAQQKELDDLLGRLGEKYRVGLTLRSYDLSNLPFHMTLGDKKVDIPLDDWGSGTRNRMLIMLTLFRAHQISESTTSASKITPIIIVEEPESFLHPSAQAHFGKILQDLSEEFKVQVIATTHSPYMLSQDRPESNILLERQIDKKQLRRTEIIDTSGDNWMHPFGLALGINNDEFIPWKEIFFNKKESFLLVEGETDKEYFELLKSAEHGDYQLPAEIEVFPYNGCGNLKKGILLRFLKSRYKNVFITYDLDSADSVRDAVQCLGFEKGKDHIAIGLDIPGKRNIEGMLPDCIMQKVYQENSGLIQQAMHGTTEEKNSAKQRIKKLCLQEFKEQSRPGTEYYGQFYPVVRQIKKTFKHGIE